MIQYKFYWAFGVYFIFAMMLSEWFQFPLRLAEALCFLHFMLHLSDGVRFVADPKAFIVTEALEKWEMQVLKMVNLIMAIWLCQDYEGFMTLFSVFIILDMILFRVVIYQQKRL
jgi:hypothetical protein